MNKPRKERTPGPTSEEEALPPLDGDEFGDVDPDELAGYLDLPNDDGGFLVFEESFIDEEELFSAI